MSGLKKTPAVAGAKRPASDPRARSKTMQVHLLKSKIHRAQVTGASANYEGSSIMSFTFVDQREAPAWRPRVLVLGDGNAIINERGI